MTKRLLPIAFPPDADPALVLAPVPEAAAEDSCFDPLDEEESLEVAGPEVDNSFSLTRSASISCSSRLMQLFRRASAETVELAVNNPRAILTYSTWMLVRMALSFFPRSVKSARLPIVSPKVTRAAA